MGSGSTAYRIATGEAQAIQQHEKAMIPIVQARGEMELELQKQLFEQKYEQAERLDVLSDQLEDGERGMLPVVMSTAPPPVPKNLVKVALVILALVFLFKRK